MESKRKPFLREAAEVNADNDLVAERQYQLYLQKGALYLDEPHKDKDIGRWYEPTFRDGLNTEQPHGELRRLMRRIICGRARINE